ncbi:winged helix-turn-helix transcriptional regulator [Streptococcus suis]|uniref:winged helix-turn-helix transcriptional regulator n=1 Tax=Streptococcus suis TaxID=1307 RepID=UPI003908B20D
MPDYHTKNVYACPYLATQTVLSGKWNILLLHHIEDGPIRFNELHRRLTGISHAKRMKKKSFSENENHNQTSIKVVH